ncbi:MAG: 3-dehydroquinate synthase [Phycisphaeraceae bacterium]|nr:3-dehydroquinate synthase [Phycisphaeraceae bacterium]
MHQIQLPERFLDSPFSVKFTHRVSFTRGLFRAENDALTQALNGGEPRVVAFVDDGVLRARPTLERELRERLELDASAPRLVGFYPVPGGEASKNDRSVADLVVQVVDQHHICRRSWVLAIGGGAVLDAVGYGAAVAHRGVRLVRIPTTVLAQDDAGLGVKNAINRFGKKNFEGTFAVPWAVLNDADFLLTLADREWRSGFSEAVKIALLKDRDFFEEIEAKAGRIRDRDEEAALPVIRRCAELHLDHIVQGGDPFESERARPLDFGHWSAHKLEQLSNHQVTHGEAVAIGVALDTLYSVRIGWLPESDGVRVIACLTALGLPTWHPLLLAPSLEAGLNEFREHLGGELCVTLLQGIGAARDANSIDRSALRQAIGDLEKITDRHLKKAS